MNLNQTERTHSIEELAKIATNRPPEHKVGPVRILDLCCGAGGVGVALRNLLNHGSQEGRFIGVDIEDHSDTYRGEFVQADVSTLTLDKLGLSVPVDLVWMSPPCKAYSKASYIHHDSPKEVHPTFDDLNVYEIAESLGKEYVIENVPECGDLRDPIELNGPAFDLQLLFKRAFSTSFPVNSWTEEPTGDEYKLANLSQRKLAELKGVPPEWGKSALRSAIPREYVGYLLSHCPTISDLTLDDAVTAYRTLGAGEGQTFLTEYGENSIK